MIARGIRLTGLRREVLAALTPGQGVAADELKRRVALGRELTPGARGWASFLVSFARALRLLEGHGALEVAREGTLFKKPFATWVRLTESGEGQRERVLAPGERGLFGLAPELGPEEWTAWEKLLARASTGELGRLEHLLARERSHRARAV